MIAPEAVVTFERPEGFRIVTSFGFVRGEAVTPRDFLRATFRTIGTFIGVAPGEYFTASERARAGSLAALLGEADRKGANGVVRLHFDADERQDGSTRVLAYGEAVLLEPAPGAFVERAAR